MQKRTIAVLVILMAAVVLSSCAATFPKKESIVTLLSEEATKVLKDKTKKEINDNWGKPDGMLSGFYGDLYDYNDKRIVIYYDADSKVTDVLVSAPESATNQAVNTGDVVDILQGIQNESDYTGIKIDSAVWDIDNDGIYEDCSLYTGPTSGLTTYLVLVCVDGNVKYKEIITASFESEPYFDNQSEKPIIVINGDRYRMSVVNDSIIFDN